MDRELPLTRLAEKNGPEEEMDVTGKEVMGAGVDLAGEPAAA
jgi:hypothetical protein